MNQKGQIMIIALIFVGIVTALVASLVGYTLIQLKAHRQALGRVQGLSVAEAGIETAIWKLNNQIGYTGETDTSYGNGTYSTTISSPSGATRLITVDSYIPNRTAPKAHRRVQVTAVLGTTNVSFNYGVQMGNGGLEMSNNSRIVGNVYANSNIVGSNSARIEGSAIAAGPTSYIDGMDIDGDSWSHTIRGNSNVGGNARHSVLQNTTVTGNAVSDSIASCTIGGTATYDTRTGCSVVGAVTTPNPDTFEYAPVLPMPITEEQIDEWEAEATAGGIQGTQSYDSGTRTLGPKKIDGDLLITGTAEVVLTGTVWVTGQIKLLNSAILRLHPSYGSLSGVLVAGIDESTTAGYIEINNLAQVIGSGTDGSYILLLSQREGLGATAINQANGGGSAILYAGEGLIDISNSATMKEITAEKLRISNSATVNYDSGLINSNFTSGPAGGWELLDQTWQLLQ